MKFTNKQVEKDFKKIDSSNRKMIESIFRKDTKLLTGPQTKLRGGNLGHRIKYKKYRVFYILEDQVFLIFKIGQKDKNAYEGI
jgi:mRNA-degrading endonuclease RelE of RelBE toxin-antitoxin system